MQKQRLILIIGIILALIAVFMVKVYLDQERRRVIQEEKKKSASLQVNQVAVLVAKQDIPRGATIDANMLATAIVPGDYVQPRAVTSLDRIAGMVTIAPISENEQITLSKLTVPTTRQRRGLAESTPIGKRAITISVDNIASLGGMIKPGDYVDVITMIGVPVQTPEGKTATKIEVFPLFQNVLVLAVGQEVTAPTRAEGDSRYKPEEKREVSGLITLTLNPQETNLIAFVQEQGGKIRLVLRSPADSQVQPVQPVGWEVLFQYLMPHEAKPIESAEPKPEADVSYVEIYRGLKKEKVPLSK